MPVQNPRLNLVGKVFPDYVKVKYAMDLSRSTELDGVRGIAIWLVLIWHHFFASISPSTGSILAYISIPFRMSHTGVHLFFILSSFFLTLNLNQRKKESDYYFNFYMRRFFRIVPLYSILLTLVLLWQSSIGKNSQFTSDRIPIRHLFSFTQNFWLALNPKINLLNHTWSLAVEEQFYIVIPFLIKNLSCRWQKRISLLMIIFATTLRIFFIKLNWGAQVFRGQMLPFHNLDMLGLGIFLGASFSEGQPTKVSQPLINKILFLATFCYFWVCYRPGAFNSMMIVLGIFYALLVFHAFYFKKSILASILRNKFLVYSGKISYGLYIFHIPLLYMLFFSTKGQNGGLHQINNFSDFGYSCLALLCSFLLADLSWRFFENYCIEFGKKFLKARKNRCLLN